jgi:hypothetical protein
MKLWRLIFRAIFNRENASHDVTKGLSTNEAEPVILLKPGAIWRSEDADA